MLAYKNKKPLVSICIPTFNAEKTVVSTLHSILDQTYQNLEIIVVDNDSTDNTLILLQKFNDPRIKIYKNSKNIGGEKNWSRCIELAKGKYIAIYHADDLYTREMVEKQVLVFQDNPFIGAVFTMANHINDCGELIRGECKLPIELKGKSIYYFSEIFISILQYGNFLICPSVMVRSALYKELAFFNDERFGTSADLDMWLRVLEKYPIVILNENLMDYRISNAQGGYVYGYLRTKEADFFKVMDYYLSVKFSSIHIPQYVINKYELMRYLDNLRCVMNNLIKGQSHDAKNLLRKSVYANSFTTPMGSFKGFKFSVYWLFAVLLLLFLHLRLERYLNNGLHWFMYTWLKSFRNVFKQTI